MYLYCALLNAWMMRGFEHFADATRDGSSPRNRLALQSLAAAIASLTASSLAGGAAGVGVAGGAATPRVGVLSCCPGRRFLQQTVPPPAPHHPTTSLFP